MFVSTSVILQELIPKKILIEKGAMFQQIPQKSAY